MKRGVFVLFILSILLAGSFVSAENYFGDGSLGSISIDTFPGEGVEWSASHISCISGETCDVDSTIGLLNNVIDGDMVVLNFKNLIVKSKLTPKNRNKGMIILVQDSLVIESSGEISMTARGAYANPSDAGVSDEGLLFTFETKDGVSSGNSNLNGAGASAIALANNFPTLSNNGVKITIPKMGGIGAEKKYRAGDGSDPQSGAAGQDGNWGASLIDIENNIYGFGGGGSGGLCPKDYTTWGGAGSQGTCFSGGSAGAGGMSGNCGSAPGTAGTDFGGPGGHGNYCKSSYGGGGAGNPGGKKGAETGTGGGLYIITNSITNNGKISSEGNIGGSNDCGGGGSGAGVVLLAYTELIEEGSISVLGGSGGIYSRADGGPGGDGAFVNILLSAAPIIMPSRNCSSPDQILFKLYQENNSHTELYNETNYGIEVCSNVSITDRTCTDSNIIFWLADSTNSHASLTKSDVYNVPVCTGELHCRAADSCTAEEDLIASFYQATNSHVSAGNDPNYPIKICCSSGSVEFRELFWANAAGDKISNINENTNVKLTALGNFSAGQTISYKILEKDTLFDDVIVDSTSHIISQIESDSNKIEISWTAEWINDAPFKLGNDDPEYYFELTSSSGSNESGLLTVFQGESEDPTITKIKTPSSGEIYEIDEEMTASFEIESGIYGIGSSSWAVGDGATINGQVRNIITLYDDGASNNVSISFSTAGQKLIELTTYDERGQPSYDKTSILVIKDGFNAFSHIKTPKHNSIVTASENGAIELSAEESYVVKKEGATVSCIAGKCPSSTHSGISVSGTPQTLDTDKLTFDWSFSEPTEGILSISGADSGDSFSKIVDARYGQWVGLDLTYKDTDVEEKSSTSNDFGVRYGEYTCNLLTENWLKLGIDLGCSNDAVDGACCRDGRSCVDGACVASSQTLCSDYETEDECENFDDDVAERSIESKDSRITCGGIAGTPAAESASCTYYYGCDCVWDGATCGSSYDISAASCDGHPSELGKCLYAESAGDDTCEDGFLTYSWTAEWTGSNVNILSNETIAECKDGHNNIICPAQLKLPVFTGITIIASLLCIGLIYFFVKKE